MYLFLYGLCLFVAFVDSLSDLQHDINCTPDHGGLLNITIYNPGEPLSVNLTCSNGEFMFDMLTNEVVVQSAMFKQWTNQDLQHPENVCVLMDTQEKIQRYRIHAANGEEPDMSFGYCNYSVGLDNPGFKCTIECPSDVEDPFSVHLENTGDVWIAVAIRCWNDWFTIYIAPGFTNLVQAVFLVWTDQKRIYPPDACIFFDWTPRYQVAVFYGMESDWDYTRITKGCPASFGADEPRVNHIALCPKNYKDAFSVNLVNSGDVWIFVNVSCWNENFHFFLEPYSTTSLPAMFGDLYDTSAVYPNSTCVFSAWDNHVQDCLVYSEEPDWDFVLQPITCPFSVGGSVPALTNSTQCPEDKKGPIYVTLENVGEVTLSVELQCWNDWFTYLLQPKTSIYIEGAFLEWTNPKQIFREKVCIFQEFETHSQALDVFASEPDLDFFYGLVECEYNIGNSSPLTNHSTNCQANDSGLFDISLVNDGDVWLYVDVCCWNDWFEYYLEPHTAINIPAMFTDWTDAHFIFQDNVCALQDSGNHVQEFGIHSEESDWDYKFDYVMCDYSVGEDMPSVTYAMECPKGNESFTIYMANIGDTWLLLEFECWQDTMSFHLGPRSNTSLEAIFYQRINPIQKYPPNTCIFEAMPAFQEVRVYAWESDYDLKDDILQCDFSFGSEIPAVNHTTDCTPSDQGMFTVQLVNSGEVWVSVQLHCLNGMMTFYLEPKSTLSVSAVFNEWLNPEQVYPDNSCAFEDWRQYQDLVLYSEEPDFDGRTDTLSCPYSVGKASPAVEHFTDCVIGDVNLFKITLQNIGDVWVYVQLECSNGYQEYFLEPQSNSTVLGALNINDDVVEKVCVFTDGSPPHLRIYNEESDWDNSSFEILCRPDALSQSDWEADYSWKMLTKRDAHIL